MAADSRYSPGEIANRLAIEQVIARYVHALDTRTTVENDVAVVEQRMHGRTHDGTPFHNSYVWVYEFRGDLIHRMTEHANTLLAHRAFHGVHPRRQT